MKPILFTAIFAAAMAMPAVAQDAQQPQKPQEGSIPFVDHGGIQDWRAVDDQTLYVQSQSDQWFEAKTMGTCVGLPFALRIGFDTGPIDTLDRFSTIVVDGQRCPLKSLIRVNGPPATSVRQKPAQP